MDRPFVVYVTHMLRNAIALCIGVRSHGPYRGTMDIDTDHGRRHGSHPDRSDGRGIRAQLGQNVVDARRHICTKLDCIDL
jgi:hypothetical protein